VGGGHEQAVSGSSQIGVGLRQAARRPPLRHLADERLSAALAASTWTTTSAGTAQGLTAEGTIDDGLLDQARVSLDSQVRGLVEQGGGGHALRRGLTLGGDVDRR
jgi:hypothetical protein